jgi:hypothetical protein
MARTASPTHRQQLENMAATWEQLAAARRRQLEKSGLSDEQFSEQQAVAPAPEGNDTPR